MPVQTVRFIIEVSRAQLIASMSLTSFAEIDRGEHAQNPKAQD
jgi:hypothetical protein